MPVYNLDDESAEGTIITCICGTIEHQVRFWFWGDDDPINLCMSFHLATYRNIFKRIWYAIRYVFGYRSRYGEWDEIVLGMEEAQAMVDILEKFIKVHQ